MGDKMADNTTDTVNITGMVGTAFPCPNCGYCPHCGRGREYWHYPRYYPLPMPNYPYYPNGAWTCENTGGNVTFTTPTTTTGGR